MIKGQTKASNKKYKVVTKSGVVVRLTEAQKSYADTKLANPKMSLSTVAKEAYPGAKDNTISQIVNMNEKNKDIAIYSDEQSNKAIRTVVELMDDDKADIRYKAATDILDRTYGKAVQKAVTQNTNYNIDVTASKELADNFEAFLKANTAI